MKQDIKQAWVKALRSGTYQQGRGRLRDGDKFCCLGVLCDLGERKAWEKMSDGWYYKVGTGALWKNNLPSEILDAAELQETYRLIEMNDNGKSFEEIADYIEENF